MWNDFEDAWVGPPAWDYACMSVWERPEWVRAVDGHADADALAVCRELREVFAVAWYQLMACRFPEMADDARRVLAEYARR